MDLKYNKAFQAGFGNSPGEYNLDSIPVKGKIPDWLEGTLLRNGPGAFNLEKQNLRHWFDGLAMLHRFSFSKGNVSYANRFVKSKAVEHALKEGKISYSEFATDPCRSMFKKMTAVFDQKITDSAKVNLTRFEDHFIALGETPIQYQFDPQTLETAGVFQYEPDEPQHVTTVHPHIDPRSGFMYNLVTRFDRVSEYRIMEIEPSGKRRIAARHKVTFPSYIHSWGMSKNYFILVEFPFVVYPLKLLFQLKPFIENFKWRPSRGTNFYVFSRENGQLLEQFKTNAFFAFHHLNAWEREGEIIIDINTYEDATVLEGFYLNRLKKEDHVLPFGTMERFTLDMQNKNISREKLGNECIELARFNDDYYLEGGYKYVYGASINKEIKQPFYNQIVKLDIENKTSETWFNPGCYPGEPVFVKNPQGKNEDDGIVLSVVLDAEKGSSFLLILDASGFNELARAEVPHPILFGYHGGFYEDV